MHNENARQSRYERRSRPLPLAPVIALAILAAGIAYAQQNVPVPPASPASAAQEPAAAASGDDANAATPPPVPPTAGKSSPQRFEPTEKVRPDFDVAFPVDI